MRLEHARGFARHLDPRIAGLAAGMHQRAPAVGLAFRESAGHLGGNPDVQLRHGRHGLAGEHVLLRERGHAYVRPLVAVAVVDDTDHAVRVLAGARVLGGARLEDESALPCAALVVGKIRRESLPPAVLVDFSVFDEQYAPAPEAHGVGTRIREPERRLAELAPRPAAVGRYALVESGGLRARAQPEVSVLQFYDAVFAVFNVRYARRAPQGNGASAICRRIDSRRLIPWLARAEDLKRIYPRAIGRDERAAEHNAIREALRRWKFRRLGARIGKHAAEHHIAELRRFGIAPERVLRKRPVQPAVWRDPQPGVERAPPAGAVRVGPRHLLPRLAAVGRRGEKGVRVVLLVAKPCAEPRGPQPAVRCDGY